MSNINNTKTLFPEHIYSDEMLEVTYNASINRVQKLLNEAPNRDLNFISNFILSLEHENTVMVEAANELHRRGRISQAIH
jgi:hypothetical protein